MSITVSEIREKISVGFQKNFHFETEHQIKSDIHEHLSGNEALTNVKDLRFKYLTLRNALQKNRMTPLVFSETNY